MMFLNKPCGKCQALVTVAITNEEHDDFLAGNTEYIKGICPKCGEDWLITRGVVQKIDRQ